jgi:hypothetical protein
MVWFRVDDTFYGHPKAAGISNDSLATWTRAGNWSGWQLTDGAVPASMIEALAGDAADPLAVVRDLVDRRLWEVDGDGGWQFHDWAEYNPTREQVLARRKKDAARRRDWLARARAARNGVSHDVSSSVTHGVSHDVTDDGEAPTSADGEDPDPDHAVSHSVSSSVSHSVAHANPYPTRPEGSVSVQVETSSSGRNAQARDPDEDDEELTQVQALMAAAGRPVARAEADTIRATVLAKGGNVRNRRAFLGRVLGDPKQARAYAPGAAAPPTARQVLDNIRRPGGPAPDPAAQAADARRQLTGRQRPLADDEPKPPSLHGEALARAQLADSRAALLPDIAPADPDPPEDDYQPPF